jgi:excisionase family DNA binding protein
MEKKKTVQYQMDNPIQPRLISARKSPGGDSVCLTVSVEEAARMLGISRGAAYTHARDGSLPTIRLGNRLLVPRAALDKLLMTA